MFEYIHRKFFVVFILFYLDGKFVNLKDVEVIKKLRSNRRVVCIDGKILTALPSTMCAPHQDLLQLNKMKQQKLPLKRCIQIKLKRLTAADINEMILKVCLYK